LRDKPSGKKVRSQTTEAPQGKRGFLLSKKIAGCFLRSPRLSSVLLMVLCVIAQMATLTHCFQMRFIHTGFIVAKVRHRENNLASHPQSHIAIDLVAPMLVV
jgi:hypothetical protein